MLLPYSNLHFSISLVAVSSRNDTADWQVQVQLVEWQNSFRDNPSCQPRMVSTINSKCCPLKSNELFKNLSGRNSYGFSQCFGSFVLNGTASFMGKCFELGRFDKDHMCLKDLWDSAVHEVLGLEALVGEKFRQEVEIPWSDEVREKFSEFQMQLGIPNNCAVRNSQRKFKIPNGSSKIPTAIGNSKQQLGILNCGWNSQLQLKFPTAVAISERN
ncbi:hypothetical protein LWI29_016155 [Acer saccharum]|uniref:Uncharacterized protein n=1 Tax=Acer saccharum TaxID=4024 RepID=A0AA39VXA8_ACESA|nr:hypothetical protein LWI29_016155 [Acer saccharum]